MSKHVFTVEVECEDSDDYERVVMTLSSVGEITDEQSDFEG